MGIVTLQDVLESVLQERIYDEEDVAQRHLASAGMLSANDVNAFSILSSSNSSSHMLCEKLFFQS